MASAQYWRHPSVLRVMAIAGAGSLYPLSQARSNEESLYKKNDGISSSSSSNTPYKALASLATQQLLQKMWSPAVTEMEGFRSSAVVSSSDDDDYGLEEKARANAEQEKDACTTTSNIQEYDFVVIGHGLAGQSAVMQLREVCPTASIAVVDPMLKQQQPSSNTNAKKSATTFAAARCEGLDPTSRQVRLSSESNSNNNSDDVGTIIRYKHSVLIATGSRGAPPPHYLFDEKALGRILELRPTLLPPPQSVKAVEQQPLQKNRGDEVTAPTMTSSKARPRRPILDPAQVRETVLRAARKGEKVAIIGSGWDAVELAVACSSAQSKSNKKRAASGSGSTTMVFGSKGPLSHVAPQYLSAAVGKRLASPHNHKVNVLHRSLIRYVGPDQVMADAIVSNNGTKSVGGEDSAIQSKGLHMYTAKSFDLLDAAQTDVHWLVVAPEVHGPMGTAALPTTSGPSYLESAREGRVWYQTWSQLSAAETSRGNNLLACYADDGRISVNAELSAGNGIYAAGSVAKYPNPWTGSADVAGVGVEEATEAGQVAANNMVRDFYQHHQHKNSIFGFGTGNKSDKDSSAPNLKHPIPVWRSDQNGQSVGSKRDGLKDAGIYALCVGSCDSDRFSTQAFWWTNQSKRLKQWLSDDNDAGYAATTTATRVTKANSDTDMPRRRRTKRLNRNPASSLKPVYGRGIVYYLDQDSGHIQGVMVWGLPFTDNDDSATLNSTLVRHMQEIIQTNGGFRNLGQDSEMERVQFVDFLTQSSRQLVVESLSPFSSRTIDPDVLPRPLIRYTELPPPSVRRVRVLNRKQESQGPGEDMFARSATVEEKPPGVLPDFDNLRELDQNEIFYAPKFARDVSREDRTAARRAKAEALRNWVVWDWYQSRWEENEERARPPREEHLWLRKGDESRGVSRQDRLNDSMIKAIFPDGR